MEKVGIKEVKEMIEAMIELSGCMIEVFKDGTQLSDIAELWSKLSEDGEVKEKMIKAYDGYQKIPAELKDMDVSEGIEIASVVLMMLPDLLEKIKQEQDGK